MAIVTKITQQKRSPNRRNIYLDGKFAFGCHVNVVAKFRLRPGMELDADQLRQIEQGELWQECFDAAIRLLGRRLHSRSELAGKLSRHWTGTLVADVLDELSRLGYVDDRRFAAAKAMACAQHKRHGRRRALMELLKAGVKPDLAKEAVREAYEQHDSTQTALELARKAAGRLRKLDPAVARRRLAGMLQRRGFDYDCVVSVLQQVLGAADNESA